MCCQVRGMCSIAGIALDLSAFDRKVCDRSHVTVLNLHGTSELAMTARATHETRVYMECARSLLIRSIAVRLIAGSLGSSVGALKLVSGRSRIVRSITLSGTPNFTLSQFHTCNRGMNTMTCNNIKY